MPRYLFPDGNCVSHHVQKTEIQILLNYSHSQSLLGVLVAFQFISLRLHHL